MGRGFYDPVAPPHPVFKPGRISAEISEGSGSRIRIALNDRRAVFHRPHPERVTNKGAIRSVRRFLEEAVVNTMMQYKGYYAKVDFDDQANIFHGEVINLRDMITFEGETVDELRKALVDSVEDYLAFCTERGEETEKP